MTLKRKYESEIILLTPLHELNLPKRAYSEIILKNSDINLNKFQLNEQNKATQLAIDQYSLQSERSIGNPSTSDINFEIIQLNEQNKATQLATDQNSLQSERSFGNPSTSDINFDKIQLNEQNEATQLAMDQNSLHIEPSISNPSTVIEIDLSSLPSTSYEDPYEVIFRHLDLKDEELCIRSLEEFEQHIWRKIRSYSEDKQSLNTSSREVSSNNTNGNKSDDEQSFLSAVGYKEIATGTEAAILTTIPIQVNTVEIADSNTRGNRNVDRSGPPPPYSETGGYIYRDGQYIPASVARQGFSGGPVQNRTSDDNNYRRSQRPPPYSSVDPFLMSLFADKEIRSRFIQKVYTILAVQLLFNFGCIAACIFIPVVKNFVISNFLVLMWTSTGLYIAMSFVWCCCQQTMRIFPLNFFLLALFTIAMTGITVCASCFYSTYIVMAAFGITALVCTIITIIAILPCIDITGMWIYLLIAGILVMIYGVIAIILVSLGFSEVIWTIYAWLVTILFAFYLLFDTQLIIGGKRMEMSPEEYILGALVLYTDIMIIFLHVMMLLGRK